MERKYDGTYHSKTGKSVVHMVAPSPRTNEEIEAILSDYRRVFMMWWRSLSAEKQIELNKQADEYDKE